jgi:4-amino-4-deoxy-L-arabinose transferase-like glycosyltransferase
MLTSQSADAAVFDKSGKSYWLSHVAEDSDWIRIISKAFFLILAVETVFAVPYWELASITHSPWPWIVGVLQLCVLLVVYRRRTAILSFCSRIITKPFDSYRNRRRWLVLWLIVGLAARLGWAVFFHVGLSSDSEMYYSRASLLVSAHTYQGSHWPPGLSLFLAPFLFVFGIHPWVTVLCGLLLFALTYWVTYLLADRLQGGTVSLVAPALFAVWPANVTLSVVNAKEALLALLVTGSLYLYLKALTSVPNVRAGPLVSAGALLGVAALTQPGLILFPGVLFLSGVIRKQRLLSNILGTVLVLVSMVLIILPWTYRNYLVLHRIVFMTTGGGDIFYRANNPIANGGYRPTGEISLPSDEVAADRLGYQAGESWIAHHPVDFGRLVIRKQMMYLGDEDVIGIYNVWKRDRIAPSRLYTPAKVICDGVWLAVWMLLVLGVTPLFRHSNWPMWFGICFLPILYQWMIDSVFESGARHHTPYLPLLCILVAMVLNLGASPKIIAGSASGR